MRARIRVLDLFWPSSPLLLALAVAIVSYPTIIGQGPWYDEYWSVFLSDPNMALPALLQSRLVFDPHPPTYSLLNWLTSHFYDDSYVSRRLLNLVVLALAAAYTSYVCTFLARHRYFVILAFAATCLSRPALINLYSARPYFAIIMFAFVVITSSVILLNDSSLPRRLKRHLTAVNLGCTFILINLHLLTSILIMPIFFFVIASAVVLDRRDLLPPFLAVFAISFSFLGAWTLAQQPFLKQIYTNWWATTSNWQVLILIKDSALSIFKTNLLLSLVSVMAAARLIIGLVAQRGEKLALVRSHTLYIALAGSWVAAAVLAIVLNSARPIIVGRYLAVLSPLGLIFIAATAADVVERHGIARALAIASFALTAWFRTDDLKTSKEWTFFIPELRRQVENCPSAIIHVRPFLKMTRVPNDERVLVEGLADLARRHDLVVQKPPSVQRSSNCVTLIWSEQAGASDGEILRSLSEFHLSPLEIAQVRIHRHGRGFLVFIPPA